MEIRPADSQYINGALELAWNEYRDECEKSPQLIREDFKEELEERVKALFQNPYGKVAIEMGRVVGYLLFDGPWDGFFGNVKGVFSPLGGSAFSGARRDLLASKLFEAVATDLVEDGICSIGISRYAHDAEVGQSFIMNGFGIRCCDAIMDLEEETSLGTCTEDFEFQELYQEEKREILGLRIALIEHLASSPIFFPSNLAHLERWFNREEIRVFAIKEQDRLIGTIALAPDGETYISDSDKVDNICMAYVDEEYREKEVAQQLLAQLCKISRESGKTHLGVDFETMNPTALRFWSKYFEHYTYSYVRRIDERILGYKEYFEKHTLLFGRDE